MRVTVSSALCALLATCVAAAAPERSFHVRRLVSRCDLSRSYAQCTATHNAQAVRESSVYTLAWTAEQAASLAFLQVKDASEAVLPVVKAPHNHNVNGVEYVLYDVQLPKKLSVDDTVALTVSSAIVNVMKPLPEAIDQTDVQRVMYKFNAYVSSAYMVDAQTLHLRLPTGSVVSYSQEPAPVSKDGAKLKFGKYSNVAPFSVAPAHVHFEHPGAFATFTNVLREVELSLWGNVAVEEHYEVHHTGAALKQGFSRIDYQMRNAKGSSFDRLTASLPQDATDVYYRDIIGNISTSRVRQEKSRVLFEIEPRFPLFGGWKTVWYQGYNTPVTKYVSQDKASGTLQLSFDANIPFADAPILDYELKMVMPSNAEVLSVTAPFPHTVATSTRFTYLDTPYTGRPVLSIRATQPIVSSNAYAGNVVVTFKVPSTLVPTKIVSLFAAFFALFTLYFILSHVRCSIGARAIESKSKTA